MGDKWTSIEFEKIRAGDRFRLFESTGEPVADEVGKSEFVAKTNPYITEDGVWGIDIV